jgi:hypothetical protein
VHMLYKRSSLKSDSGSDILVGLKIVNLSLEHCTTVILSDEFSSFWHLPQYWSTLILNQCALQT